MFCHCVSVVSLFWFGRFGGFVILVWSFRWLRSFRFDGFVLAFRVLVHAASSTFKYLYLITTALKQNLQNLDIRDRAKGNVHIRLDTKRNSTFLLR